MTKTLDEMTPKELEQEANKIIFGNGNVSKLEYPILTRAKLELIKNTEVPFSPEMMILKERDEWRQSSHKYDLSYYDIFSSKDDHINSVRQ